MSLFSTLNIFHTFLNLEQINTRLVVATANTHGIIYIPKLSLFRNQSINFSINQMDGFYMVVASPSNQLKSDTMNTQVNFFVVSHFTKFSVSSIGICSGRRSGNLE